MSVCLVVVQVLVLEAGIFPLAPAAAAVGGAAGAGRSVSQCGVYSLPGSNWTRTYTRSEGRRVKCPGGAVMTYLLLLASANFGSSRNLQQ